MSAARQEKVREALGELLDLSQFTKSVRLHAAALAEVEEWETRLEAETLRADLNESDGNINRERVIQLTARAEAAEAERDRALGIELSEVMDELRLAEAGWEGARKFNQEQHAEIVRLEAEADRLKAALEDFAKHGTRFDCNPTVVVHHTPEWVASQEWWQNRATEMDTAVRNRARAALAPADRNTT